MPVKYSAGILPFRYSNHLEVFLVHPGGPFWKNKDVAAWSIAKGEYDPASESAETAATREFQEETGFVISDGKLIELPTIVTTSKKQIAAFALQQDFDATVIQSNQCSIEWPPRSGKLISIPEVDRAAWFVIDEAFDKINTSQQPLLTALQNLLRTTNL